MGELVVCCRFEYWKYVNILEFGVHVFSSVNLHTSTVFILFADTNIVKESLVPTLNHTSIGNGDKCYDQESSGEALWWD
jgi:hypothetical protein